MKEEGGVCEGEWEVRMGTRGEVRGTLGEEYMGKGSVPTGPTPGGRRESLFNSGNVSFPTNHSQYKEGTISLRLIN